MQASELRGWMDYNPVWLVVGLLTMTLVVLWFVSVIFMTRRRKIPTLANAKPKAYTPPDLASLKSKYLLLITEVEQAYQSKQINARAAHQKLSYLLRIFVYEIRGHRVDTLTLGDLKKTRYLELTKAVERYYLPEFGAVEQGDVPSALVVAREVVEQWH